MANDNDSATGKDEILLGSGDGAPFGPFTVSDTDLFRIANPSEAAAPPRSRWTTDYQKALASVTAVFPHCISHAGRVDGYCQVMLPVLQSPAVVSEMNSTAAALHSQLITWVREKARSTEARADAIDADVDAVAARYFPRYPTLLPGDYGKDPVSALRNVVSTLTKLIKRSPTDPVQEDHLQAAALPLVWYPGVSISGYDATIESLSLRSFVTDCNTYVPPGKGIVFCDSWTDPERATDVTALPSLTFGLSLADLAARAGADMNDISEKLRTFDARTTTADYIYSWHQIVSALHAASANQIFWRAQILDMAHLPTVTVAPLPPMGDTYAPAQIVPYVITNTRNARTFYNTAPPTASGVTIGQSAPPQADLSNAMTDSSDISDTDM